MPSAFQENLFIEAGATYAESWLWRQGNKKEPVNLSGCTARLQIRESVGAADVLLELTTANGGIILGGATGLVSLFLSDTATTALEFLTGVYDLEIVQTPLTRVRRLMEGSVTVKPQVTR
jgi:hypothetical protein